MTPTILILLQTATALLAGLQSGPALPAKTQQQVINSAAQVVQLAVQSYVVTPDFQQAKNSDIWANYKDLLNSKYLNYAGNRVALGQGVELEDGSISFGDINGDNRDDAAVIAKQNMPDGSERSVLAAMINQGDIMFNVADEPLGTNVQIFDHRVLDQGKFKLELQMDNGPRETRYYKLTGTQWLRLAE